MSSALNLLFIGLARFVNNALPAPYRQAAILNALPAQVALLNNAGTIIEVNEAWKDFARANDYKCTNYGIGSSYVGVAREAIGENEAIRKQMEHGVNEVLHGKTNEFKIEYASHNVLQKRWFMTRVSRSEQDNAGGAVVMHINITDRKLAEEKMRKSEANLNAIIENTDAHVYSIDRDFRYITFNSLTRDAVKATYGIEIKPGDKVLAFLEKTDKSEARAWEGIYTEAMLGKPMQFVKDYSKPGVPGFAQFSINPIWENGSVIGLSCFVRDVTQQRLAVEELKASEQRFRQVTNNPILGVAWLAKSGKILNANEAFCNMLGYTNLEIMDMHFSKFTSDEDIEEQNKAIQELFAGVKNSCRWEKRYITRCGEIMWGELILSSVRNNEGAVKYIIGVVQDITKRKKVEAELVSLNESLEVKIRERTAELQAANYELETFTYSVSHDLKSPLRSISGFSKILLSDYGTKLDESGRDFLKLIDDSAHRMDQLIHDLLNFAKLNKAAMKTTAVNMPGLVTQVLDEVKRSFAEFKAEIILHELKAAVCDPTLLRQVWCNLVSNAIKYSSKREQPVVEIGMQEMDNESVYYIKDNGVGFNMRFSDKLFRVFQRLHGQDEFEGTGVGLAIVQRIITRHGGRVWADGKINEGATFFFTLPN